VKFSDGALRITLVYGFQKLADDDPVLTYSPMVRAIAKTLEYAHQNDHIELTKSGFFKRSFVNWAAAEFNWPGYTEEDLYRYNKVLNELDFRPLVQMHALLLHLKLGRHFKGTFRLTKAGKSLVGQPGKIFAEVAEFYLFDVVHSDLQQYDRGPQISQVIILGMLNIEAENGINRKRAGELFYPKQDPSSYDHMTGFDAYIAILRPLCWLGLLHEHPHPDIRKWDQAVFTKTHLWKAALKLPTDDLLKPATMH
jgi:hypothetical protein